MGVRNVCLTFPDGSLLQSVLILAGLPVLCPSVTTGTPGLAAGLNLLNLTVELDNDRVQARTQHSSGVQLIILSTSKDGTYYRKQRVDKK